MPWPIGRAARAARARAGLRSLNPWTPTASMRRMGGSALGRSVAGSTGWGRLLRCGRVSGLACKESAAPALRRPVAREVCCCDPCAVPRVSHPLQRVEVWVGTADEAHSPAPIAVRVIRASRGHGRNRGGARLLRQSSAAIRDISGTSIDRRTSTRSTGRPTPPRMPRANSPPPPAATGPGPWLPGRPSRSGPRRGVRRPRPLGSSP